MPLKVVSYSLFRSPQPVSWRSDATEDRLSAYARFLPCLVRAHAALWGGWELRLHHDEAAEAHPYFPALRAAAARGLLRLVPCGPARRLTLSMAWRLKPLFDPDVEVSLTGDLDSLPILQLRAAAEEFAASGRAAMLYHGCESHNGVMGGALGARAAAFRRLAGLGSFDELERANHVGWDAYGSDEEFLRRGVWPRLAGDSVVFRDGGGRLNVRCDDVRTRPAGRPVPGVCPEAAAAGDRFAPYVGSAGYDLLAAFEHYQGLPLPEMRAFRECEGESLDLRAVMRA